MNEKLSTSTNNFSPEQATVIMAFAQKIAGLGIKAEFSHIESGPVITGYSFKLDHSQPVAKILNKEEDFALAAGSSTVTIERIGSKIVIFVPNKERKFIPFQDALYWLNTNKKIYDNYELPILLGVNHLGDYVALDLVEMPHILIAGATGSGKSVLESALLCGLAIAKTHAEMHVYLVDTKRLDLPLFEALPHVKRVVKDVKGFHNMMNDIMTETRRRMSMMEFMKVRNIRELHVKGQELPYIVVVIDELADIIEQDNIIRKAMDKDERARTVTIAQWLQGLLQICRAAGVHIVAATQRPSVKIISGDIKANLPCRIALRLPTDADSRTILGLGGAERLLGKGDMLVQKPEADTIERYHGCFVQLEDIRKILEQNSFIREFFMAQRLQQEAIQ